MAHEFLTQMSPIELKDLYDLPRGKNITLDFGNFTVTVAKRSGDWWACLNGHEGVSSCANSLDGVVGYTVLTLMGEYKLLEAMKNHPELYDWIVDVNDFIKSRMWIFDIDRDQIAKWNEGNER